MTVSGRSDFSHLAKFPEVYHGQEVSEALFSDAARRVTGQERDTTYGVTISWKHRYILCCRAAARRWGSQRSGTWGFRISVLKMRSSPHAWLNFILLSTTFIIMNSHIEIGKQNKYLNNKHLISMQVVDVESVTSFGERND